MKADGNVSSSAFIRLFLAGGGEKKKKKKGHKVILGCKRPSVRGDKARGKQLLKCPACLTAAALSRQASPEGSGEFTGPIKTNSEEGLWLWLLQLCEDGAWCF